MVRCTVGSRGQHHTFLSGVVIDGSMTSRWSTMARRVVEQVWEGSGGACWRGGLLNSYGKGRVVHDNHKLVLGSMGCRMGMD